LFCFTKTVSPQQAGETTTLEYDVFHSSLAVGAGMNAGVLPWLPTDRARYAMLMTVSPSDRGSGEGRPNNSSVPPEIFERLSPETQELTQWSDGIKRIASGAAAPLMTVPGSGTGLPKL
jgi:hypothetical protein